MLQTCEKSLILLSFYSSKVGLYSSLPVKPDFTLLGPKVMTFGVKVILFLGTRPVRLSAPICHHPWVLCPTQIPQSHRFCQHCHLQGFLPNHPLVGLPTALPPLSSIQWQFIPQTTITWATFSQIFWSYHFYNCAIKAHGFVHGICSRGSVGVEML